MVGCRLLLLCAAHKIYKNKMSYYIRQFWPLQAVGYYKFANMLSSVRLGTVCCLPVRLVWFIIRMTSRKILQRIRNYIILFDRLFASFPNADIKVPILLSWSNLNTFRDEAENINETDALNSNISLYLPFNIE